jgi:hypothetical protein
LGGTKKRHLTSADEADATRGGHDAPVRRRSGERDAGRGAIVFHVFLVRIRLEVPGDWLTGFDCPPAHTMYLDKPLASHDLMQAIARVSRVYGEKPAG